MQPFLEKTKVNSTQSYSPKSRLNVLLLWMVFGMAGTHRYHLKRYPSGILMLLTIGGLGIWWFIDGYLILSGAMKDRDGLLIKEWIAVGDGPTSPKNRLVMVILCYLTGPLGLHRIYIGRERSGFIMMFTAGGLGIWWLIDMIRVLGGSLTDGENLPIVKWDNERAGRGFAFAIVTVALCAVVLVKTVVVLADSSFFAERTSEVTVQESDSTIALVTGFFERLVEKLRLPTARKSKTVQEGTIRFVSDNGTPYYVDDVDKIPVKYRNQVLKQGKINP